MLCPRYSQHSSVGHISVVPTLLYIFQEIALHGLSYKWIAIIWLFNTIDFSRTGLIYRVIKIFNIELYMKSFKSNLSETWTRDISSCPSLFRNLPMASTSLKAIWKYWYKIYIIPIVLLDIMTFETERTDLIMIYVIAILIVPVLIIYCDHRPLLFTGNQHWSNWTLL